MALVSLENPTSTPDSDLDLINEQVIRREFLDTINTDSDDSDDGVGRVYSVCASRKHPPQNGEDLKPCSDFHQYACSDMAKSSGM